MFCFFKSLHQSISHLKGTKIIPFVIIVKDKRNISGFWFMNWIIWEANTLNDYKVDLDHVMKQKGVVELDVIID